MGKYIDISVYQGTPDFEQVKEAVDAVMIRAGYGQGKIDKQFERNISECNRLNIPCGIYWFSYAGSVEEAIREAGYCVKALEPYEVQLPVAFDFENASDEDLAARGIYVSNAKLTEMLHAFCKVIADAGYKPMLYTNPDYLRRRYEASALRYDLWLAQWPGREPKEGERPSYNCDIWQWGVSSIPGIKGNVDTNIAFTDYVKEAEIMSYEKFKEFMKRYETERAAKPEPSWSVDEGAWAKAETKGVMDGTRPEDPVKRDELAAVLDRVGMLDSLPNREDEV